MKKQIENLLISLLIITTACLLVAVVINKNNIKHTKHIIACQSILDKLNTLEDDGKPGIYRNLSNNFTKNCMDVYGLLLK